MKTTRTPSTLKLDLASEAAPPDLPAVIGGADDAALPAAIVPPPATKAVAETPLTPAALADMLAFRKQRYDGWTPTKVGAFLEALSTTCSVTRAAAYVHMTTASCYHLRNHPEALGFREAWDSAIAARFEMLSDIAFDRVRDGVERIHWWQGQEVGRDRLYSDRLLIELMRRADPERPAAARGATADTPLLVQARTGVLPIGEDFTIAAAVDTGRLGWDPDFDEQPLPPELEAEVLEDRARRDADVAAGAERLRLERVENARIAAEFNAERAATKAMQEEDEAWEREHSDLSRVLTSLTCSSSRSRRR